MIKKRGGERLLDVDGETWGWRLAGMEVLVRRPDDSYVLIKLTTMLRNTDHYSLQHDMEKRNFRLPPGCVRDFIKINRAEILGLQNRAIA